MSFFSNAWKTVQTVAKPFVKTIPIVGDFAASRINMSPTPGQDAASAQLMPSANDIGKQISDALAAERAANDKARAEAERARAELAAAEAARQKQLATPAPPPIAISGGGMPKDQMMLYGGIAAAILLVVLLGNRR